MKKISITIVGCLFTLITFSQDLISPECPEGTHPVFVNNCGALHFHRPILDCQRGFWICFENGCSGWHIECWPYGSSLQGASQEAKIIDGKANIWGQIIKGKMELHFPIALTSTPGYTAKDLEVFSVDKDDPFMKQGTVQYTMKAGQYPVKAVGNELVVMVDLK